MPTVEASGTMTPGTTAEQTLAAPANNRNYVLNVDAAAMVDGDTLVLRLKRATLNAGTLRTVYEESFAGPLAVPELHSIPVSAPGGITATLQQLTGTLRAYPWSLESL